MYKLKPEFDLYAAEYARLLQDPARDAFASDPGFFHRRKWMVIRDRLMARGLDSSRLNWLDVGCGRGDLIGLAGSNFAQAVGCDPCSAMFPSSASFELHEQPSPTELPFPDESFDFVTAVCVYHHVHGDARTQLTRSVRRVLRPGGLFCIIEHNPWNPVTQLIVRRCPVDADAELLSASFARRLVRSSQFTVLDTAYFLYFPDIVFRWIGKIEGPLRGAPIGGQFAVFCRKHDHGVA